MWWPADWLTPLYPSQLKPKTLMPSFSFMSRGDGVHVVADQAHRAGGEHGDRLGMEQVEGLLDRRAELLLAAEDDLLLLHVGGEAVGHEVVVAPAVGGRVWLRRVSQE